MALTDAEKLSCFECLEAFWADTATIHNGFGVVLTLTQLDVLKNDISTRLAALDAASEDKVREIVTEWDSIKFSTLKIEQGGTGSVQGINLDFEKQQARLRRMLHVYIPVMHMIEALRIAAGPGSNRGVQVSGVRC